MSAYARHFGTAREWMKPQIALRSRTSASHLVLSVFPWEDTTVNETWRSPGTGGTRFRLRGREGTIIMCGIGGMGGMGGAPAKVPGQGAGPIGTQLGSEAAQTTVPATKARSATGAIGGGGEAGQASEGLAALVPVIGQLAASLTALTQALSGAQRHAPAGIAIGPGLEPPPAVAKFGGNWMTFKGGETVAVTEPALVAKLDATGDANSYDMTDAERVDVLNSLRGAGYSIAEFYYPGAANTAARHAANM